MRFNRRFRVLGASTAKNAHPYHRGATAALDPLSAPDLT
jgi:hypothetical protein